MLMGVAPTPWCVLAQQNTLDTSAAREGRRCRLGRSPPPMNRTPPTALTPATTPIPNTCASSLRTASQAHAVHSASLCSPHSTRLPIRPRARATAAEGRAGRIATVLHASHPSQQQHLEAERHRACRRSVVSHSHVVLPFQHSAPRHRPTLEAGPEVT